MEWHPFEKARAYDHYLQCVDQGEIVILTKKEAVEFAKKSEDVRKYLEAHSNWLMPSIFLPGHESVKPLEARPGGMESGTKRRKMFMGLTYDDEE